MREPSEAGAHHGEFRPVESVALISSIAFTLSNFRGPLIEALVAGSIRVYALAPDYDERTRRAVTALGAEPVDISLERTGMRPFRDLTDLFRLRRRLRELDPDLSFAYFIKPVIYGTLAARLARVPRRYSLVAGLGYVFTPDGEGDTVRRRALRRLVRRLYQVGFASSHGVFFQNDDDLAYFVSRDLIAPEKALRVSGTGVDLQRLAPAPPVFEPITFLLMARLLREKGIYEYVAAARRVKASHPAARFLLLGDVDPNPGCMPREELESWAEEGLIEWPGQVDDVRPWIAQSSVYVLPSYREGAPRSTQEAMAMGRPVITTDSVGCRETVEEGINGYLVPVRDAEALADRMLRFVENPELVERMGRESRRLAEQRFDAHRISAAMLALMGIEPKLRR